MTGQVATATLRTERRATGNDFINEDLEKIEMIWINARKELEKLNTTEVENLGNQKIHWEVTLSSFEILIHYNS